MMRIKGSINKENKATKMAGVREMSAHLIGARRHCFLACLWLFNRWHITREGTEAVWACLALQGGTLKGYCVDEKYLAG